MRFRYLLPATLLVAGSAFAQTGATNAIGVWNSSTFGFIAWFITVPAGDTNASMWQCLPAEVTTYFGNTTGYGAPTSRTLSWRGYEVGITQFNAPGASDLPPIEIRSTLINPGNTERWIPDYSASGLFASFPAVNGIIPFGTPNGSHIRVSAKLAGAVSVPAGSPTGAGLAFVVRQFGAQYGGGTGLHMISTSTDTVPGLGASSYSGFTTPTGGSLVLPGQSELTVTHYFENAMIQPIKNPALITGTGQILGGGGPPAPFTVSYNPGRGAIYASAGDVISYNGNSRLGNPLQGSLGNTWFVPFVLFSGDLGPGDPTGGPYGTGEVWNTGAVFVYGSPVRNWIDDLCAISGACPPGTGAIINPANSSWALWEGLDLTSGFLNFSVLVNGLALADVSSGPAWAGPSTVAFDSVAAPLGLIARNPVNAAVGFLGAGGVPITTVSEFPTMLTPQAGYTPSVLGLSFGTYPGGLGGNYFAVQCWMLSFVTNTIVDMSNLAVVRLL